MPFGDPDYSEVLSQLTTPDHGDLQLGEADAFDLGDYDLGEEEAINPGDCHLDNRENIDSRVNRFDRLRREEINKGFYDEAVSSSSSDDTEVIPGGTRLTERFKDRLPLHKEGINCNGRLPIEAHQYKHFDAMEENSTQPATQPIARKKGFNSMLSEQDEADIICILLPTSPTAHEAVELTANAAPQHILQNHGMSHIYEAPDEDMTTGGNTRPDDDLDDSKDLNPQRADPDQSTWVEPTKDIALRFSSKVHNLGLGFTFGRSPARCDLLLTNNDGYKISNRHFRIFMKNNGSLMIEDTSTNGTIVDDIVLRGPKGNHSDPNPESQHTLCNGDTIEIPLRGKQHAQSIRFCVKMPMRSESGQAKYEQNCYAYIKCVEQAERQYGFLAEATRNGNPPLVPPVPMHALPQGIRPETSPRASLLAAATGANSNGMQWGGGTKYNVVGFIGAGAFANVYKLSSKRDGEVFAVKQLDKSRLAKAGSHVSKIYNELNVVKSLRHPNIVKYVDHHETKLWLFIIMEYVPCGDLGSWTRDGTPMPECMCIHVARQILQAIDYLHQRGITHRDLKPDNVLMESDCPWVFKLSDFGLSKIVRDEETFLKTFCGTMMYCAPEVYPGYQRVKASLPSKRSHVNAKYDHTFPYQHSVDIWGLGAVLYHLLSGEPPFTARHDPQGENMLWNVMHLSVNWERLKMVGVSQWGVEFLSRMLVTDPSERASDAELLDHPWIRVAEGPADAPDCVLSDPSERLNAHASQLSIGDEEDERAEGQIGDATEDPRASKRARSWVPDMTRNLWGETASMVVRNQQQENQAYQLPLDTTFPPPPVYAHDVGSQPQPNRLFGEIGPSALASSGALGMEGNRALHVHEPGPGSYDVSFDALYNDSGAVSLEGASAASVSNIHGEFQHNADPGTTQNNVQNPQQIPGPTYSGGAPSLLGTEALVGRLNMTSTGSGASAQAENRKPATPKLSKDRDSPSVQPSSKRSSQDMLPPEIEGPSKRSKTAGVEHPSGELPIMLEGYSSARRASIEDLRQKSMSPMSRPGSRGSNHGGYQDGQLSREPYKSTYDLPTTANNSRQSSQPFGADDDVIMGDDEDSDDEVSRLEEELAAAKAKKVAKAASRATSRPSSRAISRLSSRPTSSHADPTSTIHSPMTGSAIFDATAHLAPSATASFVKPPLRFGNLQPTRGSIHTPAIYITERLTTYGRKPDSTFVHPNPREDRIPKQALDIQMWYPGIEADIDAGNTNWMDHPKLEAILRTHASLYVLVNGVKLKKGKGEYLWGRLRTGDEITVVEPKIGGTSAREMEYLRFRCEFFVGISKNIRKPGEKAFVVEVEKDKFKVAEDRKSRESTVALGASKNGEGASKGKGKGRDTNESVVSTNKNTGKS